MTVTGHKPAYAVLNTAARQGDAAPPLEPPACRPAAAGSGRARCAAPRTPLAVRPWLSGALSWSPPASHRPSTPPGRKRRRPLASLRPRCSGGRWARTRTWTAPAQAIERERTRQIARIGNNLNQIARWANTQKTAAEAVSVVAHLVSFERSLLAAARIDEDADDAH